MTSSLIVRAVVHSKSLSIHAISVQKKTEANYRKSRKEVCVYSSGGSTGPGKIYNCFKKLQISSLTEFQPLLNSSNEN